MSVKGAVKERVKDKSKPDVREPKMYKVIMLNDDFTTMDFVVRVLMDIFGKDPQGKLYVSGSFSLPPAIAMALNLYSPSLTALDIATLSAQIVSGYAAFSMLHPP